MTVRACPIAIRAWPIAARAWPIAARAWPIAVRAYVIAVKFTVVSRHRLKAPSLIVRRNPRHCFTADAMAGSCARCVAYRARAAPESGSRRVPPRALRSCRVSGLDLSESRRVSKCTLLAFGPLADHFLTVS